TCLYGGDYHLHSILESLNRYANIGQLSQIGIDDYIQCPKTLNDCIDSLSSQWTTRFTHLNVGFDLNSSMFERIASHFPSLTTLSLKLNLDKMPMMQLINGLSPLKQLKCLELKACFDGAAAPFSV